MTRNVELTVQRLVATGLARPVAATPAAAAQRLACAQGQDLPGVIASLALRIPGGTATAVTDAMTSGDIVRGYPMRGTVFAVHRDDIAWMSEITRPRLAGELRRRRASQDLDDAAVMRIRESALAALDVHREGLSRAHFGEVWREAGIEMSSGRLYHCISTLMIEAVLCYGPWDAALREQRIVAAETWLPASSLLAERFNGDRHAAVVSWLRRYLQSHGPATVRDFAWWTKLSLAEIRAAAPEATKDLEALDVAGEQGWADPAVLEVARSSSGRAAARRAMLLSGFDELVLGAPDRGFLLEPDEHAATVPGNNGVFRGVALVDAIARGTWRRTGPSGRRRLQIDEFVGGTGLTEPQRHALSECFAVHPWVAP